jgi:regulation of enolase protein 1 (concanavalin A-like superfamily)
LGSWGDLIDPDNDCKVQDQGGALLVEIPGTLHDLNADIDKFNAPRVVREVTGDFSVTVKVAGQFQPGPQSTKPRTFPYNGVGIFVWQDSDNYIFLGRAAMLRNNNKVSAMAAFEEREWGARAAVNNRGIDTGDVFLRLERRGNRILGYTSKDGASWTRLDPMETTYPGTLKVGLYAVNTSSSPLAVRFEQFSLGKPGGAVAPKASPKKKATPKARNITAADPPRSRTAS